MLRNDYDFINDTVVHMTGNFDPYHRWLGIPPKHQPPDYYRLLALEQFEDDEEVIRDAAEQRIAHIRNYRLGEHGELAQKLLNELGRAKACLLDDRRREDYDRQLQRDQEDSGAKDEDATVAKTSQSSRRPVNKNVPPLTSIESTKTRSPEASETSVAQASQSATFQHTPQIQISTPAVSERTGSKRRNERSRRNWKKPVVIGSPIVGGLLLLLLLLIVLASGNEDDSRKEEPRTTAVQLSPIGAKSVNELDELQFKAEIKNGNSSPHPVTFRLTDAPIGATLDKETGLFRWTPSEAQGPGTYQFVIQAFASNSTARDDEAEFVVQVNEVNSPPKLKPIANLVLKEGDELQLKLEASDSDEPAGRLTYRIEKGTSKALKLNPSSGSIRWKPPAAGKYEFIFAVSDNGNPPLSDLRRTEVIVKSAEDKPDQVATTGTPINGENNKPDPDQRELIVENSIGMKLRLIPAGEFMMGSSHSAVEIARMFDANADNFKREHPQHRIRISRDFYLGTTEVTQGQWRMVIRTTPWSGKTDVKEGSDYPATYVSWDDAVEFCRRLSAKEGVTYRLPTEAEWEYACRAGSRVTYSFGNDASQLGAYAWYDRNAGDTDEKYAHIVGTKRANAWGLYDMHGNVREWCQDWYDEDYYVGSPTSDPEGPRDGASRVLRGGGWRSAAWNSRSAYRSWHSPVYRYINIGFRVARTP